MGAMHRPFIGGPIRQEPREDDVDPFMDDYQGYIDDRDYADAAGSLANGAEQLNSAIRALKRGETAEGMQALEDLLKQAAWDYAMEKENQRNAAAKKAAMDEAAGRWEYDRAA